MEQSENKPSQVNQSEIYSQDRRSRQWFTVHDAYKEQLQLSLVLDITLSLHSLSYLVWGHEQKGDSGISKESFSASSIYRWPLRPHPAWP